MQLCTRIYYSNLLHTSVVAGRCGRQPQTYVKPEATITVFELLMMSGVSLETFKLLINFFFCGAATQRGS